MVHVFENDFCSLITVNRVNSIKVAFLWRVMSVIYGPSKDYTEACDFFRCAENELLLSNLKLFFRDIATASCSVLLN